MVSASPLAALALLGLVGGAAARSSAFSIENTVAPEAAGPLLTPGAVSRVYQTPQGKRTSNSDSTVPRAFIVEFADDAEQQMANSASQSGKHKRSADTIDIHDEFNELFARSIASLTGVDESDGDTPVKRGILDSALANALELGGLTDAGHAFATRYQWNHDGLFRGLSVSLASSDYAPLLSKVPGVKNVSPVRKFSLPKQPGASGAKDLAKNYSSKKVLSDDPQSAPQKRQFSDGSDPNDYSNDSFEPHVMTGVDRLHAEGFFGANITIGIVDSGVDYRHPALNGGKPAGVPCFGKPECQVIGGHNFLADTNSSWTDNDPLDDCEGHGTHVASIAIGRKSADNSFYGVAPQAKMKAYRTMDCTGGGRSDTITAGMLYAAFDGVDLLSMSLGGPNGWSDDIMAAVASRIAARGIPVVVANGNDGFSGAWFGESPAAGVNVTSVGTVQNSELIGYSIYVSGMGDGDKEYALLTSAPWEVPQGQLPVKLVDPSLNVSDEACDANKTAAAGPFNNTVVLFDQGSDCYFSAQQTNIFNNGAVGMIQFNSGKPFSIMYTAGPYNGMQTAVMRRKDGLAIKAAIAGGANVTIDFTRQCVVSVRDCVFGGLLNEWSSFTPYWEMTGGPAVSAPGGNILGAYPMNLGEFVIMSGTSMATPFVAGVVALYASAVGGVSSFDPDQLRSIWSSNAVPTTVDSADDTEASYLDSVAHQGGGLINAYNALHHTTQVTPTALFLNDTANAALQQTIYVTNAGKAAQTYQLAHDPAGTLFTMDPQQNRFMSFPMPWGAQAAGLNASASSLTVQPGQTVPLQLVFTAPDGVDPAQIPVYSGFVNLTSSDPLGSVSIPYMGVVADMSKQEVFDLQPISGQSYPFLGDAAGNPVYNDSATFSLAKDSDGNIDAPGVFVRLRVGTRRFTVDLVKADTLFKPTVPINDPQGSQAAQKRELYRRKNHRRSLHSAHTEIHAPALRRDGADTYDDIETVGNVLDWADNPRDSADPLGWASSTAVQMGATVMGGKSGTEVIPVQDGHYRFLVRAQKLLHANARDDENSYESYLTHAFVISGANATSSSTASP